jgi:hypothetical protein
MKRFPASPSLTRRVSELIHLEKRASPEVVPEGKAPKLASIDLKGRRFCSFGRVSLAWRINHDALAAAELSTLGVVVARVRHG